MTVNILKSHIDSSGVVDFAATAAKHAIEMREWRAHQARVAADDKFEADKRNEPIEPIKRHHPLQMPRAHPLVERAVNQHDEMDYEVEDDTLEPRKHALLAAVSRAEHAAIAAVMPPAKQRHFMLREQEISASDVERMQLVADQQKPEPSILAKIFSRKPSSQEDMQRQVDELRPADDTRHIEAQNDRRRRIAAIAQIAAKAHHDIDDLTLETIDAFQVPTFEEFTK